MNTQASPELGRQIEAGGIKTNYLTEGDGSPVILVHGSGPGVTGYANWRLVLPQLAKHFTCYAPDIVGFGYTERPDSHVYKLDTWIAHLLGFMDSLGIAQSDFIGNSFGGALSLALAVRHPERVRRLVLMGSVGLEFPITKGLDAVWGYQASTESMSQLIDFFAYDRSLITPALIESRYKASIRPGWRESYEALFPAPRQRHIAALATPEDAIQRLEQRALVIHGREDKVIPLEVSLRLHQQLRNSELHVFGNCGHWTQVEKAERFCRVASDFLLQS